MARLTLCYYFNIAYIEFIAQIGGIGLGLSISGAVFINKATAGLSALLPGVSRADLQLAISGTSGTFFESLPEDVRSKAIEAIVLAMRNVFIPVYVGAAVCLVAAACFTVSSPFSSASGE